MPKLEGLDYKEMFGMSVDKENTELFFNDQSHAYVNKTDGSRYISVTTLIGEYENKFDEEFWARYKSLELFLDGDVWSNVKVKLQNTKKWDETLLDTYNINIEDFNKEVTKIKEDWAANRDEACEHGSWVHSLMENSFYGKSDFDFGKYGYCDASGEYSCPRNYYELNLENAVYPEFLMSWTSEDGLLKIAGQADLIIKQGNSIWVLDWKGLDIETLIPTPNGFVKMKNLKEGDIVYDQDGLETKILHKSETHYNPCYKIKFDNNDTIIADADHRWLTYRGTSQKKVLTTEEMWTYMEKHSSNRKYANIFKIDNPKAIVGRSSNLPLDPYVFGAWLGDGASACGSLTQASGSPLWEELIKRGFKLSENHVKDLKRAGTESRTIYNIRGILNKMGVLNNKHIPEEYLFASYEDRLDLLRGLMDTDGSYNKLRKRFVMGTSYDWQAEGLCRLLATFGIKPTKLPVVKHCNGKSFPGWDVCFTTTMFNPFLTRNQDIKVEVKKNNNTFRNIISIEKIDCVPTQCIEVDSPSHTYLCTERFIVTHNTNREIKKKSFYDKNRKDVQHMKYPLNNFMDCNYYHYQLQLSMYAWILQQINPEFEIKGLSIIHIDRQGKQTEYPLEYCKKDIERMVRHYHKELQIKQQLSRLDPYKIG